MDLECKNDVMEQQMIIKFDEKVNVSEIIANDEIQVNKIKALTFWDFNTISVGILNFET